MFDPASLLQRAAPLILELELESLAHARDVANFLADAKVPVIELQLGHPDAWKMLGVLRNSLSATQIGLGRVMSRDDMLRAADEADFVSSTGFIVDIETMARKTLLAYLPLLQTEADLQAALSSGHRYVKFQPPEGESYLAAFMGAQTRYPKLTLCPADVPNRAVFDALRQEAKVPCASGRWLIPSADALAKETAKPLDLLLDVYR